MEGGVDEARAVAAAQKDPSRFAALYESNFARVYAYIARRIPDRDDAEDLTAEVFHSALRSLSKYEHRGLPFVAWLLGIAAHLLSERRRHTAKRQDVFDEDRNGCNGNGQPTDRALLDPRSIGSRITDSKIEEYAMIYQLVDNLPADQRLVILRRFVSQKSVREIAVELGRTEGAIKQLQFRALENLRMRMRGSYVESV